MAVNFTTNLPTSCNASTGLNSNCGVNEVARQKSQEQQPQQQILPVKRNEIVRTDEKVIAALDAQREQDARQRTTFDNPDTNTKKALALYNDVANGDKKDQLHSLLGVDLYA